MGLTGDVEKSGELGLRNANWPRAVTFDLSSDVSGSSEPPMCGVIGNESSSSSSETPPTSVSNAGVCGGDVDIASGARKSSRFVFGVDGGIGVSGRGGLDAWTVTTLRGNTRAMRSSTVFMTIWLGVVCGRDGTRAGLGRGRSTFCLWMRQNTHGPMQKQYSRTHQTDGTLSIFRRFHIL